MKSKLVRSIALATALVMACQMTDVSVYAAGETTGTNTEISATGEGESAKTEESAAGTESSGTDESGNAGESSGTDESESSEEPAEAINGLHQDEDGNWYYYKDNEVDTSFTGIVENEDEGTYMYILEGAFAEDTNSVLKGTVEETEGWWHIVNGVVSFETTLAKNDYGWWYCENGKVNFSYTGLAENAYGWWYCSGGKVQFSKKDVLKGTVDGVTAWWYVNGGKVQFVDTVAQNSNGWWCIQNGKVNFSFTGLAKNDYGWWYCSGGKVDFNKTDVLKGTVDGVTAWWYVKSGKVQFVNTVAKNSNGWWCIQNGKVNFSFNGFASNDNGWFYCSGGKVNFSVTGLYKGTVNGTTATWYVKGGKVQTSFTGMYGKYYIVNGAQNTSYTGTVTYNGNKYNVINGVVGTYGYVYAEYTSKYSTSNVNRSTNLAIATKAINGTIIPNGGTFDFNAIVGPRTAAKGYKEAIVYSGGEEVPGIGGGICQVATTVYNAALLANFKITSRSQHSMTVHYCKLGYDAAVSYGVKNVKFVNNSGAPIKIEGTCSGGKLTFRFLTSSNIHPASVKLAVVCTKGTKYKHRYTLTRTVNGTVNYSCWSEYSDD